MPPQTHQQQVQRVRLQARMGSEVLRLQGGQERQGAHHGKQRQSRQDMESRHGFHQIVIRTLSGFRYLCQQLAYLVLVRIFLIASKIGESLGS